MWRRNLKVSGAAALAASGIPQLVARITGCSERPLVLGYHRVVDEYRPDPLSALQPMQIDVRMLESHIDWVARRYRIVSLDELGSQLTSGAPGRRLAAVTLDDGYRDAYEVAFPLFRRKGIPAAVFVVSGLIGSDEVPPFDRLYYQLAQGYRREGRFPADAAQMMARIGVDRRDARRVQRAAKAYDALQATLLVMSQSQIHQLVEALEAEYPMSETVASRLRCVTWDMLERMSAGGMTIGSHTCNHIFLTRETRSTVSAELVTSKNQIEGRLGIRMRHFAYPAGEFSHESTRAVAAAGYDFAYTICGHVDPTAPHLTISRKVLWQESCVDGSGRFSSAVMAAQASGILDFVNPPCRLNHRPPTPAPDSDPVTAVAQA